jgi:hypothetical protein
VRPRTRSTCRFLSAVLTAAIIGVPVLLTSGCGSACKGTVQRLQLLTPDTIKLTVHNNARQGSNATFCYPTGSKAALSNCTAGAQYPQCSK